MGGDPDSVVTGGVEFDSRAVGPGGLFAAFVGANADGHDFVPAALAAGAVAVLGTRPTVAPTVVVSDPLAAMGQLARAVVDRLPELTIVGITGSSGKTSTKDLLVGLLARLGPTVGPPGSFNNELGLPHTVLRVDAATRFLVLEMGARGPGHLTYLCEIAPPKVAVVVNVGVAHIGEFGSVDAIAAAKAELVRALPRDGLAVLNADDPKVRAMASQTAATVVLAGEAEDAVVRAEAVRLDERGRASYTLATPEGRIEVQLGVSGRHQAANSVLAAATARALGLPLEALGPALRDARLVSNRRMDVFDRPDGVTVIDDSYNANPASTAAALHAQAAIGQGRRRVAVLGYLAELGAMEREGHAQVGRLAAELGVDRLVVVGAGAEPIHDGAVAVPDWGGESVVVSDQDAAVAWLRGELRPGDVVLVKGSRYRTWVVADQLRADELIAVGREARGGHRVRAVFVAAAVAFLVTILLTPVAIRGFTRLKAGQPIRTDGPQTHLAKMGTPTMGGVVFILATVIAYVAGHFVLATLPANQLGAPTGITTTGVVLLGLFVGLGAVGFVDDYLKVRKRNSLGLSMRQKLLWQTVVGLRLRLWSRCGSRAPAPSTRRWPPRRSRSSRTCAGSTSPSTARWRCSSSWCCRCPTRSTSPTAWTASPPARRWW